MEADDTIPMIRIRSCRQDTGHEPFDPQRLSLRPQRDHFSDSFLLGFIRDELAGAPVAIADGPFRGLEAIHTGMTLRKSFSEFRPNFSASFGAPLFLHSASLDASSP
jgi:hypothetical protein